MKYRPLPIQSRLQDVLSREGEPAMEAARGAIAEELFRTEGFQLIVSLLRSLEAAAQGALRASTDVFAAQRLLGGLNMIENIRRGLTALMPDPSPASVDWFDDEAEEFTGPLEAQDAFSGA